MYVPKINSDFWLSRVHKRCTGEPFLAMHVHILHKDSMWSVKLEKEVEEMAENSLSPQDQATEDNHLVCLPIGDID